MDDSLREFGDLSRERDEIDARLMKLRQFIYVTMNMLPDEEKKAYESEFAAVASATGGLTDAIREVLKLATQRQQYFTAAHVRDHLVNAGFDFSRYSSNPLASVSTILRRFKDSEVQSITLNGTSAYRWILRFPRLEEKKTGRFKK